MPQQPLQDLFSLGMSIGFCYGWSLDVPQSLTLSQVGLSQRWPNLEYVKLGLTPGAVLGSRVVGLKCEWDLP